MVCQDEPPEVADLVLPGAGGVAGGGLAGAGGLLVPGTELLLNSRTLTSISRAPCFDVAMNI